MEARKIVIDDIKGAIGAFGGKWAVYKRIAPTRVSCYDSLFEKAGEYLDYEEAKANANDFNEAFVCFVAYSCR